MDRMRDLKSVAFRITDKCNLNCVMCGQAADRQKGNCNEERYLKIEELERVIDQVSIYQPQIYIWGGEPLIYPHLERFIKYAQKKGIRNICITTNGVLLNRYFNFFVDSKITELAISIDGLGDIHNKIRGAQVFEKVIRNLKMLNDYKKEQKKAFPIVDIHCVIVSENYRYLEEFVDFFEQNNICRRIRIQLPMFFTNEMCAKYEQYVKKIFNFNRVSDKELSCEQFYGDYSDLDFKKLDDQINAIKRYKNIIYLPQDIPCQKWFEDPAYTDRESCKTPYLRLNIEPNGDLLACTDFYETKYGNVRDGDLKQQFNSELMELHRKEHSRECMGICSRCSHQYIY